MTKNKIKQTIKFSFFSLVLAIAMLFSFGSPLAFSVSNFVASRSFAAESTEEEAKYSYKAESVREYLFEVNQFNSNNSDSSSSVNSGKAQLSSRQYLIDYVPDNKEYYPIVKHNGISTIKTERDEISDLPNIDKLDDYAGVISANNYRVAKKDYGEFETVETADGTEKKVYIILSKASSDETESEYTTRLNALQSKINELNTALSTTYSVARYYVQSVLANNYENTDFTLISKDSSDYTEDIKVETDGKVEDFDLSSYSLNYKKEFTYKENSLYLQSSSSYQLTNNSYYVFAAWVYTAGDAEASIEIFGTNFSAKSEQIKTNGTWVRVYIFVATRAQDSTNVNLRLYYGDSYGVTGSRSLESYKNGKFPGTQEDDYMTNRLVGTVAFDNINVYSINYTDFVNRTINGHGFGPAEEENTPENITPHYLADGKTYSNVINNSKAVLKEDGTLDHYTEATYSSAASMTRVDTYVDRFAKNPFANSFDATFDTLGGKTTAELVYEKGASKIDELDYYSYENNNSYAFSYYVPRYSSGTTYTTTADINDYKAKYSSSEFAVSVVDEAASGDDAEFEAYDKIYYDELGNTVKVEDTDGKKVDRTDSVRNNTFASNNKILKIQNNTSFELGLVSPAILVPAQGYYRISVWVFSNDKDAIATAKAFASIKTKDALVHGQLVISSGATSTEFEYNSDSYNGWREITLFVQGNPTTSQNIYLALLASKNSTIYFDNIKVESCTSSAYDSATSSDKINLASYGIIKTNVSNGNFDAVTVSNEDALATYPYVAENWTIVKDSTVDGHTTTGVVSGVVSTKESEWSKLVPAYDKDGNIDYYDADETVGDYLVDYAGKKLKATTVKKLFGDLSATPTTADTAVAENIYAVELPEDSDFMMRSSSISFSSSNVYKLTFNVWFGNDFDGTFVAKLVSSTSTDAKTVASITVDNSSLVAKNMWQTFTIYVRTGNTSQSLPLLFSAVESTGTFFIKDVNYSTLVAIEDGNVTKSVDTQFEELFDAAISRISKLDNVDGGISHIERYVDFKNSNFSNHSAKADGETGIYDAYGYTAEKVAEDATYAAGTLGVVELGDGFKFDGNIVGNVANTENTKATTALVLANTSTDPKPQYIKASNSYTNTLASKKYFKVTVDILTSDMGDNGLTIIANGFDTQIENITATDSWKTYTFYLRTGSDSISTFSLSYELGSTQNGYTGWAMVSNMQLAELTESKYNEEVEAIPENDKTFVVKSLATEEDGEEEQPTENTNNFSWQTFFLVFSTVLLVASLVVALVAVIIKRNRKKKPVKVENLDKTNPQGGIQ